MNNYIRTFKNIKPKEEIKSIKEEVGDKKVITGISGGVDSTVVGTLLNRAIGNQSKCVFVNTGLLRKDEPKQIIDSMQSLGLDVHVQNSQRRFLGELKNVMDPEEKRKIIGREFIRVFESEAKKLGKKKVGETASTTLKNPRRIQTSESGYLGFAPPPESR